MRDILGLFRINNQTVVCLAAGVGGGDDELMILDSLLEQFFASGVEF